MPTAKKAAAKMSAAQRITKKTAGRLGAAKKIGAAQKKTIAEGDNPYLVRLAEARRTLATKRRSGEPSVKIAFLALIAVGEFIVGAISAVNTAKQLGNISDQLSEIRTGLDALQKQVADIANRLDQIVAEIANLLPAIQNIVNQAVYRNTVNTYLGLAHSANQNIATYNTDPTVAWQRIAEIKKALSGIQDAVNVIFDAAPMTLDVALQIAPLISTWITEWDMNEAVWKSNEPTHIIIKARDHKFVADAVIPNFSSFFDRCDRALSVANSDLKNIACPGFPDNFALVYDFDIATHRFSRASSFPARAHLFKYDSYQYTGPLRISQNKGHSVVWMPAVKMLPNGTAQPNADLDNPTFAYTAWQDWAATRAHLKSCEATLVSLADSTNQRKKVMAAFASL
jgi:hypothetical protein